MSPAAQYSSFFAGHTSFPIILPPSLPPSLRALHDTQRRLVGVCFGHQIIAQALGGKVEANPVGFTYGRRVFSLLPPFPSSPPPSSSTSSSSSSSLYYHHNDIVTLPPSPPPPAAADAADAAVAIVGTDPRCSNHGMRIGKHILTVQGKEGGREGGRAGGREGGRAGGKGLCKLFTTSSILTSVPPSFPPFLPAGHPEFSPLAPSGHRALQKLLEGKEGGREGGRGWGREEETDSLWWAKEMLALWKG